MKALITSLAFTFASALDYDGISKWYQGIEPENVVFAVSCGSDEPFMDVAGITYEADRGYSNG